MSGDHMCGMLDMSGDQEYKLAPVYQLGLRLLFPQFVRIFYSEFPTPYAYYSLKFTHYSQKFTYYSA